MSESFLTPSQVRDFEFGKIYAQDHFRTKYNDTSELVVNPNPMPDNTHQCWTVDNPSRKYYFKIQS